MKTFDEKDLITWANRDKAIIGNEYYFGNTTDDLNEKIKINLTYSLDDILDGSIAHPFVYIENAYACILPVEAVKEEKKYRACETIKEFYELVSNLKCKMSEKECIDELLCTTIHFRNKYQQNEFYTIITQINIIDGEYLIVINGATFSFNELFNKYEIEKNGEWQPFGIIDSI